MTKTLSTTSSLAPVRLHDLEAGFIKKKGGPAHQLVSACESCKVPVKTPLRVLHYSTLSTAEWQGMNVLGPVQYTLTFS